MTPGVRFTRVNRLISVLWDKVLIFTGVLYVLLPTSPINMPIPGRDSGVFLYMGWRILNGEIPYRDVWDHKPPLIYFLNALGLGLTNNSRWGVWVIEFIALFIAAYFGYKLIKKAFGTTAAVFSIVLGLLTLISVINGGNFTTEYTLPLQFASLWLIYDVDRKEGRKWKIILIGLLGAIAFFTKQTSIGVWLAILVFVSIKQLASRNYKRLGYELVLLAAGGIAITIFLAAYFGLNQALLDFWDAAFRYNFIYVASVTSFVYRLAPILVGLQHLATFGLIQVSFIGFALTVVLLFHKRTAIDKQLALLTIAVIDLPLELLLVSTSGNMFSHYFMTLLPVLTIFTGVVFWMLDRQLSAWEIPQIGKTRMTIFLIMVLVLASIKESALHSNEYRLQGNEQVVEYIEANTRADETVLLWGAESSVNFATLRASPTRFPYQYPLFKNGYTDEVLIIEFLDDVLQTKPALIIDTRNPETPFLDFSMQSKAIGDRIDEIKANYEFKGIIGNWDIYEASFNE